MEIQNKYQIAIKFAAEKHGEVKQTIPSTDLPYVVHLSNVAMEVLIASNEKEKFNSNLAIQIALLHDILEDTNTTFAELSEKFGEDVANGVLALTKNSSVEKKIRMSECLKRIKFQPKEVWIVKLADRITNLQTPPKNWSFEKIQDYQKEAVQILQELSGANKYLENRLKDKINEYSEYCVTSI